MLPAHCKTCKRCMGWRPKVLLSLAFYAFTLLLYKIQHQIQKFKITYWQKSEAHIYGKFVRDGKMEPTFFTTII